MSFKSFLCVMCLSVLLVGCEQPEIASPTVSVLTETPTDDFEKVIPDRTLHFPADHGEHPTFKTEWWYLTANLKTDQGERYGVQWTQFRIATGSHDTKGWGTPQIYMAHVVVSDSNGMQHAERFSRGGIGQAGVQTSPYRIWLDNWSWQSTSEGPFPGQLSFEDNGMAGELTVLNKGEIVLHGDAGYSKKHPAEDRASYYYSAPFLQLQGKLTLNGKTVNVQGEGWYDREWSSSMLSTEQQGWDWFSIHLDDGSALMAAQIRSDDRKAYSFGSRSWPDGRVTTLSSDEIYLTPISYSTIDGKVLPLKWRIDIPSQNIKLSIGAERKQQWLPFSFPYWEGQIMVKGSHNGRGFMELTGY
ncbi:lipocalin-like domain-containing protein [Photobacterium sanguinicancri]|uniref:Lipocalin-like domain-containing protein n=1 Tax=Photobacterium sanguinicancri TaxID=875932 RepID=A0AAW7Y652_9GAMM|nr:lipocalin-like domain-containing protein [Photobacterium sanguinicancri]MDO6542388.1 lipocalin-like domain-containing protein [Photobacterium sanguinicancri]